MCASILGVQTWARGGEGALARAAARHRVTTELREKSIFHFLPIAAAASRPKPPNATVPKVLSQVAFFADLQLPQVGKKLKKIGST